ncbi:Glycoside hydrolase, superfamily [Ophiocordyceps camponoti-floridani]|uniref:glucan endo-1,3-beta-D-glucosidase n=1 Tax=Ophiocordyceps camponoti-floridani TaxID=2030778 RepID=A0A8H4Q739_9HYPO|nr:Glycoside hydrolase, superfamily [Ophiocordyceps camponoti-floridani]
MQRYPGDDGFERYPLQDSSPSPRQHHAHNQAYRDNSPVSPYHDALAESSSSTSSRSRHYPQQTAASPYGQAPAPPPHEDARYYSRSADPYRAGHELTASAAGGVTMMPYDNYNANGIGPEAYHSDAPIPPPPSRTLYSDPTRQQYSHGDPYNSRGPVQPEQDSHATLNPFGTPSATHSPSRSVNTFGHPDSYGDDHYQAFASNPRPDAVDLGLVDPHDIEDDGDDGLSYSKGPKRTSFFAAAGPDGAGKRGIGAAAASTKAFGAQGPDGVGRSFGAGSGHEKPSAWLSKQKGGSKKWKWVTIIVVFIIIVGAIVGGVVGSLASGSKSAGKSQSAADDTKAHGDLGINSDEIKALLGNPNLKKVFPGMDYTPLNTQYPDCVQNPPSQNNVTRDVAVLSQLTNKIRLYGTDCNQTEMVLHAVKQLKMEKNIKVWLGVWQDKNETTNSRQLSQMWNILDQFGADPFEGIIVANEILFRKEMTITSLASVLSDTRKKLASKNIKLPVATSDLGDDWTAELAQDSDYVMANIHPFFAGVSAKEAASWTWSFWKNKDGPFWKSDKNKNIIAETGWPSAGGKHCGQAMTTTCEPGSVAGISEMNRFMEDWVCDALKNGTQYFWFEAFDEPWKIRFNEKDKEWEDKWGLLDINRNLKKGVKIPDCGGQRVS